MEEVNPMLAEIARLNTLERQIIDRFIHRERVEHAGSVVTPSFGDRVADRVAAFGGSWTFILLAVSAIVFWMAANSREQAFDPYPYILLNLLLSCLAALQAPIILMSQNRQAAHDRLNAEHDYQVNAKAELEIVALHAKLDEIRDQKWADLMRVQERQLSILTRLAEQT